MRETVITTDVRRALADTIYTAVKFSWALANDVQRTHKNNIIEDVLR
jgi:hypothetical protein